MTKYNPGKAREELLIPLEERVIEYAERNHGKGNEVAERLKGDYRKQGIELGPLEILDEVCGDKDSLEEKAMVPYETKPSKLKVGAKTTANLVRKVVSYPLLGVLPGKSQNKIANWLGDNARGYTNSSLPIDVAAWSYLTYSLFPDNLDTIPSRALALVALISGIAGFVSTKGRLGDNNPGAGAGYEPKQYGSPFITAPLYATLYALKALAFVGNKIKENVKENYKLFWEKETKLLEQKKE